MLLKLTPAEAITLKRYLHFTIEGMEEALAEMEKDPTIDDMETFLDVMGDARTDYNIIVTIERRIQEHVTTTVQQRTTRFVRSLLARLRPNDRRGQAARH